MATSHELLRPYQPSTDNPFDAVKAAHLLNRAGFGGTPEEIEKVMQLGPEGAVDWLFDFPDAGIQEQTQDDLPNLSSIEGYPRTFRDISRILKDKTPEERQMYRAELMRANLAAVRATAYWWMKRMAFGPNPLQEKLTLFWHGHFTTSARDERAALLMWNQNELLRQNAAGNFRDFVRQISRNPAMLDYLNNQQNKKKRPNENYARELMELFTLGIGNYTEDDIKQAARAFTGWGHDGEDFIFRKYDHDDGDKTFFGKTGTFDGDDIIEIILSRPQCAKYISSKLFKFFAYDDVEEPLAESMAALLRENKYELRPLLRAIFTSQAFYTEKAIGTQIKSPVQLVVGTVRMLGLDMPAAPVLQGALNQMGQVPLMPPNVKGWPGGRMWINTSTLFVRYNTAVLLAGGGGKVPAAYGKLQKPRIKMQNSNVDFAPKPGGNTAEAVADYWISRLIHRPIEPEKKKILVEALGSKPENEQSIKKMVQLLVSTPDYQLC
ncbi:MAG TPA: DUF1800 domain-containing protein [Tepidisphaeraceae bacterium]|jgi:hypothetical protein